MWRLPAGLSRPAGQASLGAIRVPKETTPGASGEASETQLQCGRAFDNTLRSGGSVSVSIVAAQPPGVAVNQVELKPDGAGPGFDSFRAVWSTSGAVDGNQRSALFAFTSDAAPSVAIFSAQGASSVNAPTFGTVSGRQGGGPVGGSRPNDTPEPWSVVLCGVGRSCLGARAWRNRRRTAS